MRNTIHNILSIFNSSKPILIISVTILFFNTCDILNPDDENDPPGDGSTTIGTLVIGPGGGEINLDSIIVKVPANAFNEENEITVSVEDGTVEFGEYANSALFQVSGLPGTINKPIRLSIKYNGAIEVDTLIALGELQFATSLDSLLYSYQVEDAVDSSGYLMYDLPAYSNIAKISNTFKMDLPPRAIIIQALKSYTSLISSKNHFKIRYPKAFKQEVELLADYFESAYDTCLTMGFSYSARVDWPVKVTVKPGSGSSGVYYFTHVYNMTDQQLRDKIYKGNFVIDIGSIFWGSNELRALCGHEFLHLVQNLYEFSSFIEPEQLWLQEATSSWIEDKFSHDPDYIPSCVDRLKMYMFDGWQYNGRGYPEQGYGLSFLIKGITEEYGDGSILKIFEIIKNGILPNNAVDPVDAVLLVINEPVEYFWHRVLGSYVLGYYCNNRVNIKFLEDLASYYNTVTIDTTDANKKHSINATYHDLSGKLIKVRSGDYSTLKKAPLSFTVSDPVNCGILVCKYKTGSEITQIGEVYPGGTGLVIVDDTKPIFDAGYELVVMVSNSKHDKNANYQGQNPIKLDIELLIEPEEPPIEDISLFFRVTDALQKLTFDGSISNTTWAQWEGFYSTTNGSSSFNDKVFSTVWNNVAEGSNHLVSGDMTVTLLDEPRSVNVNLNYIYTTISSGKTEVSSIDFQGLPFVSSEYSMGTYGYLEEKYAVYGSDVCGFSYSHVNTDPVNNSVSEILGFGCGPTAEFYIMVNHEWVDE